MVEQTRQQRFVRSLRDWGCVFMLAVWLQSIMASAIPGYPTPTGRGRPTQVVAADARMPILLPVRAASLGGGRSPDSCTP